MTTEEIMRRVIETARRNLLSADEGVTPIVSVITRDGEIVGEGCNTSLADHDPTAHAEVMAIRDACSRLETCDLSDCEIYAISETCPMCVGAIYFARLDRLYYGNARADTLKRGIDIKYLFREVALPAEMRVLPSEQLLGGEARDLMNEWAKTPAYRGYRESLKPNPIYLSASGS